MNKRTKFIKKHKNKNKTKKYYGGKSQKINKNEDLIGKNGIFDIIGNKLTSFAGNTASYITSKGLRLAGLEYVKKDKENEDKENEDKEKKDNEGSGIFSSVNKISGDIVDVFDKGSAAVVENINDVLRSPKVVESTNEAIKETAEIGEKVLENLNEKLSTPEFKKETKETLDNISDYAEIAVEAANEPINKAIDNFSEAGTKAASGIVSGVIKVGTDALGAVPGAGAIVDVGKMINDTSKAVLSVVEASSDAVSTASNLVKKTSANIEEGVNELVEIKKETKQILDRTNKSLDEFVSPLNKGGAYKTKRTFLKNKSKSKKVRFAI